MSRIAKFRIWCNCRPAFPVDSRVVHDAKNFLLPSARGPGARIQVSTLLCGAELRPERTIVETLTLYCSQKKGVPTCPSAGVNRKSPFTIPVSYVSATNFSVSCWKTVATQWVCKAILGDAAFAGCDVHVVSGTACSR